ncbi:extracellular solute-binding protein [Paenibacillus methanolicus]|uniref:Putative aldouronate transport system substrate-binding protein n=1 Tax=Paenibacillus methanolicus TaxID=582686 RepID=A0A5S5CHK9_9BACL|nr:extracellular solute-binding protein [Paenibacillus methanolicus]TYP79279.1 putative aldouronate transport system substrate-binding protein [Paenibacillus methanolicus]
MNKKRGLGNVVKVWSVMLCTLLALAACSGNGGNASNSGGKDANPAAGSGPKGANTNAGGEKGSIKESEPMKISASIYDRGKVAADEGSYEHNRWTKWMDEQSGVDVEWVPITRNQEADKFNVLVASGQAPDLISSYDRNLLARFVDQGAVQPIDDYLDQYSTVYKQYLEAHPELKPYVTFNGQIYAVASLRNTRALTTVWVRQDWLDKLKLKVPTTIEELIDVARAFRDQDPDGNGKPDTVPIAGSLAYTPIIEDLFFARGWEWFMEDGKLVYGNLLDRYKDVLAFQKQVYDEGLVDKEYLTDKNFARQQQLWVTGKAGIYFEYVTMTSFPDFKKNNPDAKVVPIPPVATKYGTNGYQEEVPNYLLTVFNQNMKNPEAAFKFLDWMLADGWDDITSGEEGVHSTNVDGIPVIMDTEKYNKEVAYAAEYRLLHQDKLTAESIAAAAGDDPIAREFAQIKGDAMKVAEGTKYRKDLPYRPDFKELIDMEAQFMKKRDEIIASVVIGGSKHTPEWGAAELLKEWNRLGGEEVNKKAMEWYEKNKANFE